MEFCGVLWSEPLPHVPVASPSPHLRPQSLPFFLSPPPNLQAQLAEEEAAVAAGGKPGTAGGGSAAQRAQQDSAEADAGLDSLDAFMAGVVEAQIEADRVGALKRQLADLDGELERTGRLLAIADPDG